MALLDRIPEDSYGVLECFLGTLLFSIPALVMVLMKVNLFILFFYYSVVVFMILGFASHIRSHDVEDSLKSLISKAKGTKKQIDKFKEKNEI
jgi:hypothetical protein